MEFGKIFFDTFDYSKHGVFKNMNKWMRLILAFLCLCIPMNGYIMRIFRGANPAPEIDNWGALFVDGIKLMALWIVYVIPICVITYVLLSVGFSLDIMRIIVIIYVFFYLLIMPTSSINLARSNSFYEGLNFRSIIGHIGRIGWINNIIAFIILAVDLFILYIVPEQVIQHYRAPRRGGAGGQALSPASPYRCIFFIS